MTEIRDTSLDFDDCIGKEDTSSKPGSLASFLGMNDIPETEEELNAELAALDPKKYWKGMPEYVVEDQEPRKQLIISFRSEEDMLKFGETVLGQKLTPKTKSVWWPAKEKDNNSLKRWIEG